MAKPAPTLLPAISVEQIGVPARRALTSGGTWTVAAVFPRAVYLNHASDWVCLVPIAAGPGPLYLTCTNPPPDWTAIVTVGENFPVPDLSAAATWTPPPPPDESSASGLAALDTWLTTNPPPTDGLGVFATQTPAPANRVATRAASIITALARRTIPDDLVGLVGLGPGLTPSGDDLLGAFIITLRAVGDRAFAQDLAVAITPDLDRTTPISAAYLRAAIDGEASARVHAAINAVMSGDDFPTACAALTAVGHTSGWDALAGVALAVRSAGSAA